MNNFNVNPGGTIAMNGGILAVPESRANVEAMKRAKQLALLERNKKIDVTIDQVVDITKKVVAGLGFVATIALTAFPLDGPIGEIAAALATPALVNLVENSRGFLKGILIKKDPEQVKAAFTDMYGNTKEVAIQTKLIKDQKGKGLFGKKVGQQVASPNNEIDQQVTQDKTMGGIQ